MKPIITAVLVAATATLLAGPIPSWASEDDGVTDQDVSAAEGVPPVTPHSTTKNGELRNCLSCHEEGKNGAPLTPHPERKTCTQCHVQGEITVDIDKPVKKSKKK